MTTADELPPKDLFISHASEDKEAFVRPLASLLEASGYSIWFDEFELRPGDLLSNSIDLGLHRSHAGIVVLSTAFFKKKWTRDELGALQVQRIDDRKLIIPIWYQVTRNQVAEFSPFLANVIAIDATPGVDSVIRAITKIIRPHSIRGNHSIERGHRHIAEGNFADAVLNASRELERLFTSIAIGRLGLRYFKAKKPVQYSIREWLILLKQKKLISLGNVSDDDLSMLAHFRNIAAHGGHNMKITRATALRCLEITAALLQENQDSRQQPDGDSDEA